MTSLQEPPRIVGRIASITGRTGRLLHRLEGYVWNAVWEGYRVDRYARTVGWIEQSNSRLRRSRAAPSAGTISTPCSSRRPATQSPERDLAGQPTAGGLYAVRPGIGGLPDAPFAG